MNYRFLLRLSAAALAGSLLFPAVGTAAPAAALPDAVFAPAVAEDVSVPIILAEDIDQSDGVYRAADLTVGDGTIIAIIDSGFDPTHPAFTMPAGATETIGAGEIYDLVRESNAESFAYKSTGSMDAIAEMYVSAKVPFVFDYAGRDTDVTGGREDHGTHVAATAAGGGAAKDTVPGAAPAAQLLLMKVFDDTGTSCREIDLVSAVEDAVRFGADVINLSLGSIATAADDLAMSRLASTIRAAEEAGVVVVCAIGNDGVTGEGGQYSDAMRADNPDTGLPSEPAILPEALAVGAAYNRIYFSPYLTVGDKRIPCDDSYESDAGILFSLMDLFGGETLPLVFVPGVGTPADFAGADVRGKIALVSRGQISFEEKAKNAALAGARAVIVYNTEDGEDFLMSVGMTETVPAVSVSYEDGVYLQSYSGQTVTVAKTLGAFPAAFPEGVSAFSSWGPTADMTLKPDLVAVGESVASAVSGGGYEPMSGTSMAAPQAAGLAAAYVAAHRDLLDAMPADMRAGTVRAALMSAAVPMTDAAGTPLSPRAQGAGRLDARADVSAMHITLTGEDGYCQIPLGDKLPGEEGTVTMSVTVSSASDKTETLTLSASVITENYRETDGIYYTTYTPLSFPATVTFSEDTVTLAPGESRTVTVTVTPDETFLSAHGEVFQNGFYLEGYITAAAADGSHAASIPYFGFCGDWNAAPMLDGGDWDGYESYFGGQYLYLVNGETTYRTAGEDSDYFAFSPNGDGVADTLAWLVYPLRHIENCRVVILSENGEIVCENAYTAARKSYVTETGLLYRFMKIWDGTDGMNTRFFWEDGRYTARLTAQSHGGATQTVEIPLIVDTVRPTVTLTREGDRLTAVAEDGVQMYSLSVYTKDFAGAAVDESVTERTESLTLTAEIPEAVPYVYVRAEDAAGNVTLTRYYPAEADAKETEIMEEIEEILEDTEEAAA